MREFENTFVKSKLTDLWHEVSRPPPENLHKLWEEHNKINNELEMLKLRNCDQQQKPSRIDHLPSFTDWCVEMGIRHSGLEITCSPNGLCLRATESLEKGEIAAEVPLPAIFSTDVAESIDTLRRILRDELLQNMENVALAMCLAHEVLRGSTSKWAAYFNVLPATFSTPIFYTGEQFNALKPSPVFEDALKMYRSIARQFVYFYLKIIEENGNEGKKCPSDSKIFVESPFTATNFTFDFYRWCVSVVSTRINLVPSQQKKNKDGKPTLIPALIPFIDMANHANSSTNAGSVYFECETNSIKIQLNKGIETGEELFIHYGPRTNSKFLLHNGFVPQFPNPDDFLEIKIGLNCSSPNIEAKMQQLAKNSIIPTNSNQTSKNVAYSFRLKTTTCVSSAKQSKIFTFAKIFVSDGNLNNLDTEENIQKAKKFICDRLTLILRAYASKQKHVFGEGDDTQRLKDAEKEIICSYLKCFEEDP